MQLSVALLLCRVIPISAPCVSQLRQVRYILHLKSLPHMSVTMSQLADSS